MYSSYKSLFKIQWKIYSIGDKPLPRAIPLDTIAMFVILLPIGALLAKPAAPILSQPYWGVTLLFTGALAYLFNKFDPQGRPFLVFLYDFIMYLIGPQHRDFTFRAVPRHRKLKLFWDTMVLTERPR